MKNYDVKLLKYEDEQYPECLRNIHTPPTKLYCMGNINLLNKKRKIAIIGCRDYSEYGRLISQKFAYELARMGFVIVSGAARGIDSFSHKATLNTCKYLNGELYSNNYPTISLFGEKRKVNRGFEASFVGVTPDGEISTNQILSAIKDNTALVSMLYVNNEIGTISDVESVSEICKKNNIALHSDLTQALGKIEIDVKKMGIDYASCSAHKIYGPKGIGAAFMKSDAYGIEPITAFMHGGEQEFGFRAGTHAVHNIVGFGKAAEIAFRDLKKNEAHIKHLDDMLINGIRTMDGIYTTVNPSKRIPGIISLVVDKTDFHNERFIKKISNEVALSTGSACSAGEPSYVIQALGMKEMTTKVLRVSINKYTTEKDISCFLKVLENI